MTANTYPRQARNLSTPAWTARQEYPGGDWEVFLEGKPHSKHTAAGGETLISKGVWIETFDHHATPQPIIAKPEQPPFAPKQFVRIKSSGTILNVARCEKRVVHGALRWVVDDLNGMRWFAADCELIKNMELVNAETGEAVIHLEPQPVRYACTKLAAVGGIVKYAGVVDSVRLRVRDVQPDGIIKGESLDGKVKTTCRAEKLEYVPECAETDHIVDANKMIEPPEVDYNTAPVFDVMRDALQRVYDGVADETLINGPGNGKGKRYAIGIGAAVVTALSRAEEAPAEPVSTTCEFDFDEAANKAAAVIYDAMLTADGQTRDWCSDQISAQIRPGVQQLYAKLQRNRCDTCGANTIDGCTRCGAPQCCPQCCKIDEYERDQATSNEHRLMALKLLSQCDNRLFLVGGFEIRKAAGGWKLYYPTVGALLADAENVKVFTNPVQAALRAKELADVGKQPT